MTWGTTNERILAESASIRRDVYAQLLREGRGAGIRGPDDPRLQDYLEWAAISEGHGRVVGRGDDFGARFVNSPMWQAYRDGSMEGFAAEQVAVPVMAPDELHTAATLAFPPDRMATDENMLAPLLSAVFGLVNVIPSTGLLVRPMGLTATEVAGAGLPDGAASVEVTATGSDADVSLFRWAQHVNVLRRVLDDSEAARRLINELMRRHVLRNLAFEILAGDGSTTATRKQLLGINSKSGVGSVAVATGDTTTALATAVQTVEAAGFEGPHALVCAPLDKRKILLHTAYLADRFPSITRIVSFNRLTAGTAYLGQYGAGNLYMTSLVISVSQDHDMHWTTGRATVQPETDVYLDLPHAAAFCKITGV